MKKIVFIISVLFIILVGCSPSEINILEKIDKKVKQYEAYECLLDIEINIDGNESKYRMKENYKKGKNSSVEVIYPKENSGISLKYLDDKIVIENASIDQSITLNDFKSLENGFLVKDIFSNIGLLKFIEEKEIDGKGYYAFDYSIDEKNKYNSKRILIFDKKELQPFSLEIFDRDGRVKTIVYYQKFKALS